MGFNIIENVAVKEIASNIIRENLVQNVLVVPNKGADFQYATDVDGDSISVTRTKMGSNSGREVGNGLKNGGYINADQEMITSDIDKIPLVYTYDKTTPVPNTMLKMNGTGNLLNSLMLNVTKQISRHINSTYFAQLITSNLNAAISATSASGSVTYKIDPKYVVKMENETATGAMNAFYKAAANLSEGDLANGYDIFPTSQTQLFLKGAYRYLLQGNAGVFVGNFLGQQMVASGSFTAYDAELRPNLIDGYVGELNGALVYEVGNIFTIVEAWLGQTTLADKTKAAVASGALNNLNAIYVCGAAVAGGIDRSSEVKVIDLRGGQGVEVQPSVRCGFAVFSPKGVQLITSPTGLNAADFVTYTGNASTATKTKELSLYLPGNR